MSCSMFDALQDLGAVFQYGESSNPVGKSLSCFMRGGRVWNCLGGHASLSEPIPGSCPTCAWFDAGPVKVGRQ